MKMYFEFSNVFSRGLQQYKKLNNDDKSIINTFIAILLGSITSTILIESFLIGAFGRAASGILLAASISLVFAIFDKLGVLTPIETRIESLSDIQSATSKQLHEVVEKLDAYSKYQNARFSFGFNGIRGMQIIKSFESNDSTAGWRPSTWWKFGCS